MGFKKMAEKFITVNKRQIRGKIKHSRTGACTCRRTEKCFHGKNYSHKAR